MLNSILLQAAQGAGWANGVMIVALIVIFYFFLIRPQSKKQKEMRKFRSGLQKGDKVFTQGGIYGKVSEVREKTVLVEIAQGVKITVDMSCLYPTAVDAMSSGEAPKA